MKLSILGASGGCGKQLVTQAIARGHIVTAVVRNEQTAVPEGVTRKVGSLTDAAFLKEAVRGSDVVLSALGLRMTSIAPWAKAEVPDFLSKSTPALIEACKAEGIKRVIAISAGGVRESYEFMPGAFKAIIRFSALKHVYAELAVMEELLLASGLDVCICRPTGLTDGPTTGQVKVVTGMKGRATISRADVAAWMLDEATKPSGQKTPVITVTGA